MKNFLIAKQNDNGTWDVESHQMMGGRSIVLRVPSAIVDIKPQITPEPPSQHIKPLGAAEPPSQTIWTLTVPDAAE